MVTIEGIINVLKDDVHKLWKCNSEQLKLEKQSLEGHLLSVQLNYLHTLLSVWKLFPVQIEVIFCLKFERTGYSNWLKKTYALVQSY
jgi:hypothetical protein